MGWLRLIPKILKYLVTIGPLVYDATTWGIKIFREFRKVKPEPPASEPAVDEEPKPDLDPG